MKTEDEMRVYKRDWARKKRGSTQESLDNSQTFRGRKAELLALEILQGATDCNKEKMNNPGYDLLWNNKKIDVKSCELYKRKIHHGKKTNLNNISGWWTFNKECKSNCDYFLCVCLINRKPSRIYIIPSKNLKGFTIGQKSEKFDKYLIKKYE